jgi:AcrR family transcriptional regulator
MTLAPRQSTRAKADALLKGAAALIAEKGFEATAIRDVGRELAVSLGGMYYYFTSKNELLFQIQLRTFTSLLDAQQRAAGAAPTPVAALRALLGGHLAFFEQHPNEMKICTAELDSLKGEYYDQVLTVRRKYYRLMADVVAQLIGGRGRRPKESAKSRHVTLFIFGMLNWAFMWYRASKDGSTEALADEMLDLVLHGIRIRR